MTIQEARKQVDAVENKVNSSFHDLRSSAFGIADLVEKPKGLNTTAWISRIAGVMCFVGLILGGEANRVREEKNAHVQEIERHNQTERSNLQKLRQLRTNAFSGDSAVLTEGIVRRLNEAEDTRVELLRSMGIDAIADYVSVGGEVSADFGWSGGGFADLDLSGVLESVHGRGSEGTPQGNGVATPVGGALNVQKYGNDSMTEEKRLSLSDENNSVPNGQLDTKQTNETSPLKQIDGRFLLASLIDGIGYDSDDAMKQVLSEVINEIWDNPSLSVDQKCLALLIMKQQSIWGTLIQQYSWA